MLIFNCLCTVKYLDNILALDLGLLDIDIEMLEIPLEGSTLSRHGDDARLNVHRGAIDDLHRLFLDDGLDHVWISAHED
jgi:hypothetical protein